MAGIFPDGGTPAANTFNGASPINLVEGCEALYYRSNCVPVFDPFSANAVISEIANAVNLGGDYDCSRLDNLKRTLESLVKICSFENVSLANLTEDDALAGCFNGKNGKLLFSDLVALVSNELNVCDLPTVNSLKNDDWVIVCVDGKQMKAPFKLFKGLVIGDDFTRGPSIFNSASYSGVNRSSFKVPDDIVAFGVSNVTKFPYSSGVGENSYNVGYTFYLGPPGSGGIVKMFNGATTIKRSGDDWIGKSSGATDWQVIQPYATKTFDYYAGQFSDFNVWQLNPVGG